jgi:hypothetical protein
MLYDTAEAGVNDILGHRGTGGTKATTAMRPRAEAVLIVPPAKAKAAKKITAETSEDARRHHPGIGPLTHHLSP